MMQFIQQKASETTTETPHRIGMWETDEPDVEFEEFSKEIKAEWMMIISGGEINVKDLNGAVIYEYTPGRSYKAVLIASGSIKNREKYIITISDETFETEITQQSMTIGTQTCGGIGFGRGQRMQ